MEIVYKKFQELDIHELYLILKLRVDVFVVEQNCPYPELDNKDQMAIHVLGYIDGNLAAYARVFHLNDYFEGYTAMGRILSLDQYRGKGLGRKIVQASIDYINQQKPTSIKISAQTYLSKFYESMGFVAQGDEFLEDDLPHIYMTIE